MVYQYADITWAEVERELYNSKLVGFVARAKRNRIAMTPDERAAAKERLITLARQALELASQL